MVVYWWVVDSNVGDFGLVVSDISELFSIYLCLRDK